MKLLFLMLICASLSSCAYKYYYKATTFTFKNGKPHFVTTGKAVRLMDTTIHGYLIIRR